MYRSLLLLLCLFASSALSRASLTIASHGKSDYAIIQQDGATATEKNAVNELASTLKAITGVDLAIRPESNAPAKHLIVVGQGKLASQLFPEIPFDNLNADE